jgi:hypothetical protein
VLINYFFECLGARFVWAVLRDSLGWGDVPRNVGDFRKKICGKERGQGNGFGVAFVWCCLVERYGLIATVLFLITKYFCLLEH